MSASAVSRALLFVLVLTLGVAVAQEDESVPATQQLRAEKPLKIVPIVSLKPGESKRLLLSTHCTVGVTRGGGFGIAEMRNGSAVLGEKVLGHEGASYSRDGVEITIPGWEAAEAFADAPEYQSLRQAGIAVFEVTVSASNQAGPGLLEFHLVDATCSGHCATDFRVLVLAP